MFDYKKYRPFEGVDLPDRQWPDRSITCAPVWCSVDLRDGNQALVTPMDPVRKGRMFDLLVARGFKEIEVGFPAASQTDFDFCRRLIDEGRIPDDVTIQVLTQARDDLIDRTFEAMAGAPRVIVHLYNSTSPVQRRVVFGSDRAGIIAIAEKGAARIVQRAGEYPDTRWSFEYSPESFSATEADFALEICDRVRRVFQPDADHKLIINLPATVEMSTPNRFADQVEHFIRNIPEREHLLISVHPHNDRGTAVAAAELSLMAGADRIEGTLFGNGERTGNVDVVTLGMNLYTQGVDPGLDLSNMDELIRTAEYCNRMPVPARHPWAGELVFTAFSGSHQDAINKGMKAREGSPVWDVPYLPVDPSDLGRHYEAIIRINSQSGKGGIAWVMEQDYGLNLPRPVQIEFSTIVQQETDRCGTELNPEQIHLLFEREYLGRDTPWKFEGFRSQMNTSRGSELSAVLRYKGREQVISGSGSGPVEAFVRALRAAFRIQFKVRDYHEHARGAGADASAIAYITIDLADGRSFSGAGSHQNIVTASLQAILSAVNRAWPDGAAGRVEAGAETRPERSGEAPAST